jgi:hypothetical protein
LSAARTGYISVHAGSGYIAFRADFFKGRDGAAEKRSAGNGAERCLYFPVVVIIEWRYNSFFSPKYQ